LERGEIGRLRAQLARVEQRCSALASELDEARLARQQLQSYADDFRRTYAESRHRLQQMTTLYEVSTAIVSPVDPAEVLSRTIEGLRRLLPDTGAAIYLCDDDGPFARRRAASPLLAASRAPERLPRSEGILGRVLAEEQAVLESWQTRSPRRRCSGWTLALPLSAGSQQLGGLLIVKRGQESFASEERHLAEMVAAQTAMALQHARLATTDALTGLYNRRHFELSLEIECERARRTGRPLGLLMIDVDRFKRFNQSYGHPAGDAVLRYVATTLGDAVRRTDVLARLGGEEFAAILPESDLVAVGVVGERLRHAVETSPSIKFEGRELPAVRVSVGGGISQADDQIRSVDLMRTADTALRRAKRAGRNRVRLLGLTEEPDSD
jgi:diguanylate cyclase (GGDEF)-like protein